MVRKQENVELIDVTPELAREWLGFNTHNRKLRERAVNAYAGDMRDGAWRWNGETIKFASDGALLDGQHRLAAIALAEITLPMLVVRGLPNETQETIDGGAKRTFADVLALRGESNTSALAAITRSVMLWETGVRRSAGARATTNAQLLKTLEKYAWLRDVARDSCQVSRDCGLPPSIVGLCWWLFQQLDDEDAEFFFRRLADGQNLAEANPIYELRRTIRASQTVRGERSATFLTAITIKAWNAYRDGAKVRVLTYRPGGANPERFPEPR